MAGAGPVVTRRTGLTKADPSYNIAPVVNASRVCRFLRTNDEPSPRLPSMSTTSQVEAIFFEENAVDSQPAWIDLGKRL
jgi:hypothetical protein